MVLVGVLGVLLVGLLVLLGRDPRNASVCGPRWKRRLLATGLVLLTAVGIVGCDSNAKIASSRTSAVQDAALETLLKDPRWLEYRAAWARAESIAFDRTEAGPIYGDEMPAEIAALTKVGSNLDALAESGLITDVEHRYLKCELSILIESLNGVSVRPVLLKQLASPKASMARTIKRMDALGRLASSKKVSERAWNFIRPEIGNDLEVLVTAMGLSNSGLADTKENWKVFSDACEHVRKISRLTGQLHLSIDRADDKAWRTFAMDRETVSGIFDYLGVRRLLGGDGRGAKELAEIESQLDALKRAGRVSEPMAELFDIEHAISRDILLPAASKLKAKSDEVRREDPATAAAGRMTLRKAALGLLAKSPEIRPEVIGDALAIAQADYDLMSGRIAAFLDDSDDDAKKKPNETAVPASIEADILALGKKTARCDPGITDLGRQYHWVRLRWIWRRSDQLWEMNLGGYPFNTRGQNHALSLLLEADRHIESLAGGGMLDADEVKLLQAEFKKIRAGIATMLCTDSSWTVSCYLEGPGPIYGDESVEHFMKRLKLLENIHASGKLHPRVLATVLYGMERRIPAHGTQEEWDFQEEDTGLFSDDSPTIPDKETALRIDRLKTSLRAWRNKLPQDQRWLEIIKTVRFAATVAKADDQAYTDRKPAWLRLSKANLLVRELLSDGMLTRDEAVLMNHGINSFWDIIEERPVDAVQRRLPSPRTPWGCDDSSDDLVDIGVYPGYRNLGHWLDILGKAPDPDKISPIVYKEVLGQLKVIWPCRRMLLTKEYSDWDFSWNWDPDHPEAYDDEDDETDEDLFDLEDDEGAESGDKAQEGDK